MELTIKGEELTIKGEAKEFAALVNAAQERRVTEKQAAESILESFMEFVVSRDNGEVVPSSNC